MSTALGCTNELGSTTGVTPLMAHTFTFIATSQDYRYLEALPTWRRCSTYLKSLPFKGRDRVGMGMYERRPIPIPTFPLRGKEPSRPSQPSHARALRNMRIHGESSPHPGGCHDICTLR